MCLHNSYFVQIYNAYLHMQLHPEPVQTENFQILSDQVFQENESKLILNRGNKGGYHIA